MSHKNIKTQDNTIEHDKKQINIIVGNRLRSIRERLGYTQDEVADIIDMSQKNYSNIENGRRSFGIHHLINFCTYFNVSPEEILSDFLKNSQNDEMELDEIIQEMNPLEKHQLKLILNCYNKSMGKRRL